MYIPGRLRTASRPSITVMSSALYWDEPPVMLDVPFFRFAIRRPYPAINNRSLDLAHTI